jgi:hypothetical protein
MSTNEFAAEFAAADEALSQANADAAKKRQTYAVEGTLESADAYDKAVANADQVGQEYLLVRFRYDCVAAGCYVPDEYFDEPEIPEGPVT